VLNVAFFLLPKEDCIFLSSHSTIRQALERMEYHRYSAIPLVEDDGSYAGTITEGDLLWTLKNTPNLSFENCHKFGLKEIKHRVQNKPVTINAKMDDLISLAVEQNFVPVTDDKNIFIGIIRRREIIEYCYKRYMHSVEEDKQKM